MIRTDYLLLFIAMGLVTFIPRWLPLFFLSNRDLPIWFTEWLDLIPVAILSAILVPALVITGEPRQLSFLNLQLWIAFPTMLFALKTRSLGGTVVVGMLLYWVTGMFL